MEAITEIFRQDFPSFIAGFFIILSSVIAVYEIIGKFSAIIGRPVKWVREKENDHAVLLQTVEKVDVLQRRHEESVRQSIRHDEMIKEDLSSLTDTVNGIASTLTDMQNKENETKLKELKGSLVRYYHKYKDTGEWSQLEKDAFWDLFGDYEARGGDGYVHSIIEPKMRELKEKD